MMFQKNEKKVQKKFDSSLVDIYSQLTSDNQIKVTNYASLLLDSQNDNQVNEENVIYLYGYVSAGNGRKFLQDEHREEIAYSGRLPVGYDYAVQVSGDSMEPALQDGEIIFVKNAKEARNGQIIIADLNGESYVKKFYQEDDSYWLEFPDLPGAQTQGDDLKELVANANEALEGYILTLCDDEKNIPDPSDLDEVDQGEADYVVLIEKDINLAKHTKSVKKTLTIPSWLNDKANEQNINFSQTLQEALLEKING